MFRNRGRAAVLALYVFTFIEQTCWYTCIQPLVHTCIEPFLEHCTSLLHSRRFSIPPLNLNLPVHAQILKAARAVATLHYTSALRSDLKTIQSAQKYQRLSLEMARKEWKTRKEYLQERGWGEVWFCARVPVNLTGPKAIFASPRLQSKNNWMNTTKCYQTTADPTHHSPFHATLQVISHFFRAHELVDQRIGMLHAHAGTMYQVNVMCATRGK